MKKLLILLSVCALLTVALSAFSLAGSDLYVVDSHGNVVGVDILTPCEKDAQSSSWTFDHATHKEGCSKSKADTFGIPVAKKKTSDCDDHKTSSWTFSQRKHVTHDCDGNSHAWTFSQRKVTSSCS